MAAQTTMGKQISQFVNSGLLVPDKLTNAIAGERLEEKDCKKGFILDGYPRSLIQAEELVFIFDERRKTPLDRVLYFKVDAAVVVDRMGQVPHLQPMRNDLHLAVADAEERRPLR